jgi:hypothetical protein
MNQEGPALCDKHGFYSYLRPCPYCEYVRGLVGDLIASEAIDAWLEAENEAFGCRPAEMIGTSRENELIAALQHLRSGEAFQ